MENQGSMIDSNINLENLIILYIGHYPHLINVLDNLHQRGLYKWLHLYSGPSPKKEDIAALKGLVAMYFEDNIVLPPLANC